MSNLWNSTKWKTKYKDAKHKRGIKIDYEKDTHPEVKRACREYIAWIRVQFFFPKRVRIYVKNANRVKSTDGDRVCGYFFRPYDQNDEPYIVLATGDYPEMLKKHGKDNALATILWSLTHELTHYFQWINDVELTLKGMERQASNHANKLLSCYANTRDHP